jgi:essential nuclear protein 1
MSREVRVGASLDWLTEERGARTTKLHILAQSHYQQLFLFVRKKFCFHRHIPSTFIMPKATTPVAAARQARRHNPLEDDLTASGGILKTKAGKRKSRHQEEGEQFVDSKASRKILKIGQELADEAAEENEVQKPNAAFNFDTRIEDDEVEETYEEGEAWGDEEEEVEEIELAPDDLATFSKFFPTQEDPLLRQGWDGEADEGEEGEGTNLADLILEKIAAHEAQQAAQGGGSRNVPGPIDEDFEIPPKVVEVYTKYVHSIGLADRI